VERGDDRHVPLAGKFTDPGQQVELVRDVEVARRFVEEHEWGLLDERPGQDRPLLLPSADREDPVLRPLFEADRSQRPEGRLSVPCRFPLKPLEMGVASVEDVVEERHVLPGILFLGDPRDPSGSLCDGQAEHLTPEQFDRAGLGGQEPQRGPQESGLPGPVRSRQREELPLGHLEVDVL